jgi:XTP/dITP diphosphohydrolase
MKLLVATNNRGKLKEYRELLRELPVELVSPADERLELEVDETGKTFEENAKLKAQAFAERSGLVTLADDSGLEVDALDGEPGVFSARYDGDNGTDVSRCTLLLENMAATSWENRGARFRCVIALAAPDLSEASPIGEGTCEGFIARTPHGEHGFGYDPIFFLPLFGQSMAQLPPEIKNTISHRARAVEAAKKILARRLFPELLARWDAVDPLPHTTQIRIRPARFSDHSSLQHHCYPHDTTHFVRERLRWAVAKSHEGALIPLVGEADKTVIAYIQLMLKGTIGEMSSLIVTESLRGRGIATALFQVSREVARDHGVRILTVVTEPGAKRNQGLYRKLGFLPYKTVKVPRKGYTAPGIYLRQILG